MAAEESQVNLESLLLRYLSHNCHLSDEELARPVLFCTCIIFYLVLRRDHINVVERERERYVRSNNEEVVEASGSVLQTRKGPKASCGLNYVPCKVLQEVFCLWPHVAYTELQKRGCCS